MTDVVATIDLSPRDDGLHPRKAPAMTLSTPKPPPSLRPGPAAAVGELPGQDSFDRPLPPVHEQLGEPTARQSRILRNLFTLAPV